MLEDIALRYVNQSEAVLRAIEYGLVIVGAIIAGIVIKGKDELTRAPYFAYSALIYLLVSAVEIVWLQSVPAISGGYLWVLMVVSMAASVIGGFFFCRIAMARSRDAFGHGRMAALAFIPLANLWLLAKLSKTAPSVNRVPTIPLLTGGLGVLSGFAMLIAAVVLTVFIEQEADRIAQTNQDLDSMVDSMVRSRGLEATLRLLAGASEAQLPITVDDVTKLTRIEADGTQLRRTYVVTLDMVTITDAFRAGSTDGICAYEFFIPLLRAEATIREVYIRADGSPIGEVLVTRNECGL